VGVRGGAARAGNADRQLKAGQWLPVSTVEIQSEWYYRIDLLLELGSYSEADEGACKAMHAVRRPVGVPRAPSRQLRWLRQ
jgi:hypothetical protein